MNHDTCKAVIEHYAGLAYIGGIAVGVISAMIVNAVRRSAQ